MAAAIIAIHNKIRTKLIPDCPDDSIPPDAFVDNLPPPEQRIIDLVLNTLLVGCGEILANFSFYCLSGFDGCAEIGRCGG